MSGEIMHGNLFSALRASNSSETITPLLRSGGLRLERIVSLGQATPLGQWYDQTENEWVLLVAGSASLQIEGEPAPRQLIAGDYLLLPAHRRHRVESTSAHEPTVWLALHFAGEFVFPGQID